MSEHAHPELDPKLEEWLTEAAGAQPAAPADLDRMLGDIEKKMEAADGSWTFWLRSRATWMRRAVALSAASLVVIVGGVLALRENFAALPMPYIAVALGSLGVLLGLSLHQALRPLHRPPLAGWQHGAIVGLTLFATAAVALLAPNDTPTDPTTGFFAHVGPCLFWGLLFGVPVYLLLRLLDRGSSAAALLAACAAGLAGNLVLELHCPRNDPGHLMAAHFAVAVLFVAGLGIVHWLVRRRRSR